MQKDFTIRKPDGMTAREFHEAQERGRAMAERSLIANPERRIFLEIQFGIEYCKARYPEAYRGVA